MQLAVSLRDGEFVVGPGEVIHPDMQVTCTRQALDRAFEDREFGVPRWQFGFADAFLWLEQVGYMRVTVKRDPVRRCAQYLLQRDLKTAQRLPGSP